MSLTPLMQPGQVNRAGDRFAATQKMFSNDFIIRFQEQWFFKDRQMIFRPGQVQSFHPRLADRPEATRDLMTINGEASRMDSRAVAFAEIKLEPPVDYQEPFSDYDSLAFPTTRLKAATDYSGALCRRWDQQVALKLMQGAMAATVRCDNFHRGQRVKINVASTQPTGNGGARTKAAAAMLTMQQMVDAVYTMSGAFRSKDVPKPLYMAIRENPMTQLMKKSEFMNKDYGGKGNVSSGMLSQAMGFDLDLTTNLPELDLKQSDYSALKTKYDVRTNKLTNDEKLKFMLTSGKNAYISGFTDDDTDLARVSADGRIRADKILGVAWNPEGVGSGVWREPDLYTSDERGDVRARYRGGFITTYMVMGTQYLKESCAGVFILDYTGSDINN